MIFWCVASFVIGAAVGFYGATLSNHYDTARRLREYQEQLERMESSAKAARQVAKETKNAFG